MRWDYALLDINPVFPGLGEIVIIVIIIIIIVIIMIIIFIVAIIIIFIIIHHNSVNLFSCFCFKRAA